MPIPEDKSTESSVSRGNPETQIDRPAPEQPAFMNRFVSAMSILKQVEAIICKFLEPFAASLAMSDRDIRCIKAEIFQKVLADFESLRDRDPAAMERVSEAIPMSDVDAESVANFLYETYPSMQAVLWYRVANVIYSTELIEDEYSRREIALTQIYPAGRVKTGIDIDPRAKIGRRFVIDHGAGTVIGRHVEIGDDCYLLHCVNLGAGPPLEAGTAVDASVSRHPHIGNRVTIFGYVSILGSITIGDDTVVGTRCLITQSIPPNSKVRVVNQYQISRSVGGGGTLSESIAVFGIVPIPQATVDVYSTGLGSPKCVLIVDEFDMDTLGITVETECGAELTVLRLKLTSLFSSRSKADFAKRALIRARVKFVLEDESVLYVCQSEGLRRAMTEAIENKDLADAK